jgi:hypothetical protein
MGDAILRYEELHIGSAAMLPPEPVLHNAIERNVSLSVSS